MKRYLEVVPRNGDSIAFYYIEFCMQEAERVLAPFKDELVKNGLTVELHIYEVGNDTVRREYLYPGIWPQPLLDSVRNALAESLR